MDIDVVLWCRRVKSGRVLVVPKELAKLFEPGKQYLVAAEKVGE